MTTNHTGLKTLDKVASDKRVTNVWEAKKARIVAMWNGGEVDMATIAQAMGVTGWTVAKVLRDAGLRQPKRRAQ